MTHALMPAAPQPLEKENDDYFRKVGGFGWAASLRGSQTSYPQDVGGLRERASGVCEARTGRRSGLVREEKGGRWKTGR